MDQVKHFLETSTIHGLSWISSTHRLARYFWIIVVIGGFSGSGYLIYESFYNWQQSPIKTTVDILPISNIKFPNVTVCPPNGFSLSLNHAILKSEKIRLNEETRRQLTDDAIDYIQESYYIEMMRNLREDFKD